MTKMIPFSDVKKQWLQDEEFIQAYNSLELEFQIAMKLVEARLRSDLTQAEIAKRMGTTQSVIARLESGKTLPSLRTLSHYAKATGHALNLDLHP